MLHAQGHARLVAPQRTLGEGTRPRASSPEREGLTIRIEPGKEEDFRYLRGWLASSEWLDRLITTTVPGAVARAAHASSPRLRRRGRAHPTAERRLLEWSSGAARARVGKP
jgi:hypothetical protein